MDPKEFNNSIQHGNLRQVYLLYGEERYLVHHYADALTKAIGEPDTFEGAAAIDKIVSAADSLPFFSEKRLVRVKDSKLFVSGRKADSEAMAKYLSNVPESTVLVFIESEVDKRGRLYKKAVELGGAMECETPSPQALTTWLGRIFSEKGKTIDPAAANLLLRYTAHNMTTISKEAEKLAAFTMKKPEVTIQDIQAICSPTLETKVFDLISAMANGRSTEALNMYHNMLMMKEQPLMILAMIIRQFRIILMVKAAEDRRIPKAGMAKTLGLRPFIVDEALAQGRRFNTKGIIAALISCQDTDIKIKTGLVAAEVGVELLILQYGMHN
ncbi:MAG: DNA polymerase III subunit delta [Defluviitaleaceae bacterium]|nr:DNA polymerase III subunit delta [Defluviitaleaceae bacterium]